MSFIIRKIHNKNQGFGSMLRSLRKVQGIKIDDASRQTKIQKKYLEAFENCDFSILPDSLYARNFLKKYVKYLGGDPDYFLDCFEQERGTCDLLKTEQQLPRRKVRKKNLIVCHRWFKTASLIVVFCTLFAYFGWQIHSLTQPPEITIFEPSDNISTDQAIISISGQSNEHADIMINGEQILTNQDGFFKTTVSLQRGLNVITIEGKKKYSKKFTTFRNIVLNETPNSRDLSRNR